MGLYSGKEERTFQSVLVSPSLCFWFSQCPMVLLDMAWLQFPVMLPTPGPWPHPHPSDWALSLVSSFLKQCPSWWCCCLSTWPHPSSHRPVLGSWPLALQGSSSPWSSLPCSLWEGSTVQTSKLCCGVSGSVSLTVKPDYTTVSWETQIRPEEWPLCGVYPVPPITAPWVPSIESIDGTF